MTHQQKLKLFPYALLPFRCLLFITSGLLLIFAFGITEERASQWWSLTASACNILTLLVLYFFCKREGIAFKQHYNWQKEQVKLKSILVCIAVIVVVGIGGMYLSGYLVYGEFPYMAAMMIHPILPALAIFNLLVLPITTTLAEDGLYLGYCLKRIKGKWAAILLPAIFYALQHSFIPLFFDWHFILYRFLSFLPLTIAFCYYYYEKRNLIPILAGHFTINIFTVAQILMTSLNPEIYELMSAM